MSYSTTKPSQSQDGLTSKQRKTIDRLLSEHPDITPERVNGYYENCYARNWHVYIDTEPDNKYSGKVVITRCDWKQTAQAKAMAIRSYIAEKRGVQ